MPSMHYPTAPAGAALTLLPAELPGDDVLHLHETATGTVLRLSITASREDQLHAIGEAVAYLRTGVRPVTARRAPRRLKAVATDGPVEPAPAAVRPALHVLAGGAR